MIELLTGFILGWVAAIAVLQTLVRRGLELAEKQSQQSPQQKNKLPTYYLREHSGLLYVWDESETFITQGATLDAVLNSLPGATKVERVLLVTPTETLLVNNGAVLLRGSRIVSHDAQ